MADHPPGSRGYYRALRRGLNPQQSLDNARSLAQHVNHSELFNSAEQIACYLANDGEIDPAGIINSAWTLNKRVYLPVLSRHHNSLLFAPYNNESDMQPNRFGIDEPRCNDADHVEAIQLDLILLPLVAFDDMGNRLGMGGGFYDRTLAFRSDQAQGSKPVLMGLAHEVQRADKLESESWDIPLDAIATENGIQKLY